MAGSSAGHRGSHGAAGAAEYPILEGARWTKEYFQETLRDLTAVSLHLRQGIFRGNVRFRPPFRLDVWPESPAPFYTNDPMFRDAVSALARQSDTWVVAGAIGIMPAFNRGAAARRFLIRRRWLLPRASGLDAMTKCILCPSANICRFRSCLLLLEG